MTMKSVIITSTQPEYLELIVNSRQYPMLLFDSESVNAHFKLLPIIKLIFNRYRKHMGRGHSRRWVNGQQCHRKLKVKKYNLVLVVPSSAGKQKIADSEYCDVTRHGLSARSKSSKIT